MQKPLNSAENYQPQTIFPLFLPVTAFPVLRSSVVVHSTGITISPTSIVLSIQALYNLQLLRLNPHIPLVIVATINPFHINLSAVDVVSQRRFQQHLNLYILYGAAFHRKKIILAYPPCQFQFSGCGQAKCRCYGRYLLERNGQCSFSYIFR